MGRAASASCDTVKVTLNHMGNLNAQVMGHNQVLAKTADVQAVAADGMSAGAASEYVKSGDGRGSQPQLSVAVRVRALNSR